MNDRRNDSEDLGPDDAMLDRLVREARMDEPELELPEELLEGYARGTLDPEAVERVEDALSRSARLRSYVFFLKEAVVPEPPETVPKYSLHPGIPERERSGRTGRRREWLLPLAIAAGVFVAFIVWRCIAAPRTDDWAVAGSLSVDQISIGTFRGGPSTPLEPAESADDAASGAFLAAVRYGGGAFTVVSSPDADRTRFVDVRFKGTDSMTRIGIPADATELTLWFLSFPSLARKSFPIPSDHATVSWPDREAKRGALTITWVEEGRPGAGRVAEVDRSR